MFVHFIILFTERISTTDIYVRMRVRVRARVCVCECALAGAGVCVLSFLWVALLVYFNVHLPRV